jgi:integrase
LFREQLYPVIKQPVRIRVTPAMDTKLNLYGLSHYVTGLQSDAAQALNDYIQLRRARGWNPSPQDWVFVTERAGVRDTKLGREGVWAIVKNVCRRSGFDPATIWVHCFRKSFRKILNSTPQIDEDTKEALMGHKLPGSRGNYFDYHDEDEVMAKYMKAGFGRETTGSDLRQD